MFSPSKSIRIQEKLLSRRLGFGFSAPCRGHHLCHSNTAGAAVEVPGAQRDFTWHTGEVGGGLNTTGSYCLPNEASSLKDPTPGFRSWEQILAQTMGLSLASPKAIATRPPDVDKSQPNEFHDNYSDCIDELLYIPPVITGLL